MSHVFPIISERTAKLPIYLTTIGISPVQERIVRKEGFRYHHLIIVLSGTGRVICEGNDIKVSEGDAFFIPKNTPHSYHCVKGQFSTAWLTFDGFATQSMLEMYQGFRFLYASGVGNDLKPAFNQLLKGAQKGLPEENLSSLLYDYFINFFSSMLDKDYGIENTLKYIRENYSKNITLDDMAEKCNMNRYMFCRKFKEKYSVTAFEYLLQIRIQQAKSLLTTHPSLKVNQIASLTGFNDTGYFCRVFKRFENCSPIEFRQMNKE